MAPTKQPLRCEGNCQRRIYFILCSKELNLQLQLQINFNLSMRQTILWITRYWLPQSSRKFPGQNTDLLFWINKVSDVSFSNSEQACLRCAGLHAAWYLSLGCFHTETHHYAPLLLRIKIIIDKFLLKITSLKIQSDCFGINIKALSKAPNRL